MAAAKQCDRCDCYYSVYNTDQSAEAINGLMGVNIDSYGKYFTHKPKDLCPDCMDAFKKWFDNND